MSLPVHATTITHIRDETVLTIATIAAAFVVYDVLTVSEQEKDEQARISLLNNLSGYKRSTCRRGWLN